MASVTQLTVNGEARRIEADPTESLLFVLRDRLELTGSKYGCGEGRCGACTVLIDGRVTKSCITELGKCEGKQITTIESLSPGDELHPLQQAFIDCGAMQCGYCTPGMVMCAHALLSENNSPSVEQVRSYMNTNICRCGTYSLIQDAVLKAAGDMKRVTKS